jgi:hypothetical protein
VLQAQIIAMQGPSDRVHAACVDYVRGPTIQGHPQPIISGRAKGYLNDKSDLIALRQLAEIDPLSTLLQTHWPIQKRLTKDPFDRTTIYTARHVVLTVSLISMLLAAILLIGAITSLYIVTNPKVRLGMIAGYTLLFALSLAGMTSAARAEIFGATAAYAAVLVVFVSGNLGGAGGECLLQVSEGVFRSIRCPD